jgi:hypothetical protein
VTKTAATAPKVAAPAPKVVAKDTKAKKWLILVTIDSTLVMVVLYRVCYCCSTLYYFIGDDWQESR